MRRDNPTNPAKAKRIARQKYAERQINKWVEWCWKAKGKIKYKMLVEQQNKYNIKCYGWKRKNVVR